MNKLLKITCKLTDECKNADGTYSFTFNHAEMKVPCEIVVFYAINLKDAMNCLYLSEIELINISWED